MLNIDLFHYNKIAAEKSTAVEVNRKLSKSFSVTGS